MIDTTDNDANAHGGEKYPLKIKHPKRPEHTFDIALLPISGIIGASTAYAMNAVLPGGGIEHTLQVVFCGLAAGFLSYLGNKASIHKGTKLAARGDTLAVVGVVAWFLAFGTMVGTLSFSGMTYKIVRDADLREAGRAISAAAADVNRASTAAKQLIPAIEQGGADIAGIVDCERRLGCVSGRPGSGPEVIRLEQIAKKYGVLLDQFKAANRDRSRFADRLTALGEDYERTLNASHDSWGEKRAALVSVYAKVQRVATEIEAAMPVGATRGFVGELRNLNVAPATAGRIDVAATLTRHADRLEEALDGLDAKPVVMPPFPTPPGLAAGWQHLALTWPLALFAYLLECAVLYLWFTVYRQHVAIQEWNAMREDDVPGDDDDDPTPFGPSGAAANPKHNGAEHDAPDLDSDPINGPRGWSGRSRFNANKLDGEAT